MQTNNFKDFFLMAFNVSCEEMVVDNPIDVRHKQIGVLSYNEKTKTNEKKLVEYIVRKKNSRIYKVYVGNEAIEVTADHMFFVTYSAVNQPLYLTTKDMMTISKKYDLHLLEAITQTFVQISKIEKTKVVAPIYDIQVEGNENYYSNGYLSHNSMYGPSETTTGGNALKFYASQRIDVRKSQGKQLDDEGNIGNTEIRCKVVKNKLAPPFRKAELMNIFNVGIDSSYDVLRLGIQIDLIKKAGSWFSVEDTKLGQGEEKALQTLKENPDLYAEIENQIKEAYGIK
jgi:hypothetical protein